MLLVLCALALFGPRLAIAQDTAIVIQPESGGVFVRPPELPHEVAEEAVRRYNAPTTTRLVGRSRLPAGNEWRGDVAVRNGAIVMAGRIDGTLLVINGDAILDSGAVVTGDVIVVGGTVARRGNTTVGGEVHIYPTPLTYRVKGEEIALA
ncbi:MAG TPA: polymer-forming cytoskeletal protein, partial [Gemmatimonadales bacterium]|nr:polymer-forming cytoskeletal protein [Gemmatimonadales bacterium]